MMRKKQSIKLKVSYHVGGRHTLMQSIDGAIYKDLRGALFCNFNAVEFYRAVAKKIAKLANEGHRVTYKDTSNPPALAAQPRALK